jgi:hypothetical protein
MDVISSALQTQAAATTASFQSPLVLNLYDRKLIDCKSLKGIFSSRRPQQRHPWQIVLLGRNQIAKLEGLHRCVALRKLDLSSNRIAQLPNKRFWTCLPHLEVLHLNDNLVSNVHDLYSLHALPQLMLLTLYNNPVEHHPAYRHVLTNKCSRLKLLDFHIVSDEELIEDADFGPRFGAFGVNFELVLPPMHQLTPDEELYVLSEEVRLVRARHRRLSPVLIIQSLARGWMVRKTMAMYNYAAAGK